MKKIYVFGLILAFCSGVIGKTALDEIGYDVVMPAHAEVAGMDYFELQQDFDFKRAVQSIVQQELASQYRSSDFESAVRSIARQAISNDILFEDDVRSIVNNCYVQVYEYSAYITC